MDIENVVNGNSLYSKIKFYINLNGNEWHSKPIHVTACYFLCKNKNGWSFCCHSKSHVICSHLHHIYGKLALRNSISKAYKT